jgi:hypothetical protein
VRACVCVSERARVCACACVSPVRRSGEATWRTWGLQDENFVTGGIGFLEAMLRKLKVDARTHARTHARTYSAHAESFWRLRGWLAMARPVVRRRAMSCCTLRATCLRCMLCAVARCAPRVMLHAAHHV